MVGKVLLRTDQGKDYGKDKEASIFVFTLIFTFVVQVNWGPFASVWPYFPHYGRISRLVAPAVL